MHDFDDRHFFGIKPKHYLAKCGLAVGDVTVWQPLRWLGGKLYKRATRPRGCFLHRNQFGADTQHCYILGGAGQGKSSLLKEAIGHSIKDALAGRKSVFVMDSAELVDEIIATVRPRGCDLERFIVIDLAKPGGPGDPGCLPCLNMLETSAGHGDEYLRIDARTAIYKMIFESLLDNDPTGHMQSMIGFAAQTLAHMPNPTARDLLRLLRDPLDFIEGMDLPGEVDEYWRDKIEVNPRTGATVRNKTAEGLAERVHAMFSTKSISRLLLNQTPTVNLAERLNEGAIVLVATRKGQAMSEGTRLVMRFLLSMLHRAAESRHSAARHLPIAAYIDEFPDALSKSKTDESLLLLLSQGRKRRLSVVLAHQDFGQVAPSMLTGIASNADLRIIGGVILPVVVNCNGLLDIRRIEKGENKGKPQIDLLALKKGEFVAYRKGGTPRIIVSKKDPLGDMFHRLPKGKKARMRVIEEEMALIHEFMRERYAMPPDNVIHLPDRADDDGFDAAQPVYA